MSDPLKAAMRVAVVLGLCIALAACSSSAASSPSAQTTPSSAVDPLSGTSWALVTMGGQPVPAGLKASLSLAAGKTSGSSGCNTFSGPYQVTGSAMTVGPLASTQMACPAAAMTFEQAYLTALGGVTAWAVPQDAPMGTQLTLSGTGPKLVFGKPAGG